MSSTYDLIHDGDDLCAEIFGNLEDLRDRGAITSSIPVQDAEGQSRIVTLDDGSRYRVLVEKVPAA